MAKFEEKYEPQQESKEYQCDCCGYEWKFNPGQWCHICGGDVYPIPEEEPKLTLRKWREQESIEHSSDILDQIENIGNKKNKK